MKPSERIEFLFAWGKLSEDIGEFEKAFACFSKANELRRLIRPYSRTSHENSLQNIQELFTREQLDKLADTGNTTRLPVFILGMPRSGTTLTEQVLASHPDVHGAGELKSMGQLVRDLFLSRGEQIGARLDSVSIKQAAERYLSSLPVESRHYQRVTDKMPANFWHIGFIALMFPNASIIHVRRNPIDNLLSCFQQNFGQGQAFSNDLEDAAHYYWLYRQVIEHWRSLLGDRILNVDYEDLVEDPERQSRRLAEHVGLDWHEAMLAPHKTRRSIRTASQWQVRQPIHKGSVARWKRYEKQLQPLLEALQGCGIEV